MPPPVQMYPRRRVLIEVQPSLDQRVRLWLNKLRHPRDPWFARVWMLGARSDQRSDSELPM
jgi:hypothetical protein